jgi:hypothetical protein
MCVCGLIKNVVLFQIKANKQGMFLLVCLLPPSNAKRNKMKRFEEFSVVLGGCWKGSKSLLTFSNNRLTYQQALKHDLVYI